MRAGWVAFGFVVYVPAVVYELRQYRRGHQRPQPTSGDDDSSDDTDSSFDSSGAGVGSAGDSPQGKSDVVQAASILPHPRPCRTATHTQHAHCKCGFIGRGDRPEPGPLNFNQGHIF